MTGGYKIIDLYGLDLANMQLDSTKIEKIFSDIESTYKTKALLFDNYKINGIEQNATFSSAVVKNSGFEITLGDYKVLIKNDSVVDNTPHLYMHNIHLIFENGVTDLNDIYLTLYTKDSTSYTFDSFKNYLLSIMSDGYISVTGTCDGIDKITIDSQSVPCAIHISNNNILFYSIIDEGNIEYSNVTCNDVVVKIF